MNEISGILKSRRDRTPADCTVTPKARRCRDAALFHRDRGEAGKADDIAHREDIGLACAEIGIHFDAAPRVGLDAGRRKVHLIHIALSPHRIEQRVAGDLLLALQRRDHAARTSSTLSTSSFNRIVTRLSRR